MPLRVTRKSLDATVKRLLSGTILIMSMGNCLTVRVGRTDFTAEQVAANVVAALPTIVRYVPHGWKNVQAVHLKVRDASWCHGRTPR